MASNDERSTQLFFDFGDFPEDAGNLLNEEMEEEDSSSILSENFLLPPAEEEDSFLDEEEEDSSFSGSFVQNVKELEKEEDDWEIVPEETAGLSEEEKNLLPSEAALPQTAPEEKAAISGEIPSPAKKNTPPKMDSRLLKRAALAFLGSLKPACLAMDVPTRCRKYVVDGAAFWTEPDRKGVMQVVRTAIVETRLEKALCNTCENPAEIMALLTEARKEKEALEASIREKEPALMDSDSLFSEHAVWNYKKSRNPAYKELLKKIALLEHTLFHGSKFDKLRKAKVASEFYLLVPEGEVLPDSIAESWGLVVLRKDLTFHLVKEAAIQDCPESHCRHLAFNIGKCTLHNVLFAQGIHTDPLSGALTIGKLPRKRRLPV